MPINNQDDLIAELAADLRPVNPIRPRSGLLLVALAALATAGAVVAWAGLAPALASGHVSPNTALANGLLLMLGVSAAVATVGMASPSVGARYDGPRWAMAMAAVFPVAGGVLLLQGSDASSLEHTLHGWRCAVRGCVASALVAAVLLVWLRRGAPVSLTRAGVWLGVAAGALGSATYGLSCPLDSVDHLGIWHFIPVAVCAAMGAFLVPKIVRW